MAISSKEYLESGSAEKLISDITQYIEHMVKHVWKENNRLCYGLDEIERYADQMNKSLDYVEKQKLEQIGKRRDHYENLVADLEQNLSNLN